MKTAPFTRIPDGVTDEQAAVLPVAAVAALGSLDLLRVAAGQRLVVLGAAGAVGGYAVQMAVARGVQVIATVRGDTVEARRLGASEVYDADADDVASAVRESHPDGVDAVLDIVNGRDASRRDAEFLRAGGRLVSTVFGADVDWFASQQITAFNVVGHVTPYGETPNPKQSPQGLAEIAHLLEAGTITTRISTTAKLDAVPGVFTALRHSELHGKAAIRFR